jgi:hypothetical protein
MAEWVILTDVAEGSHKLHVEEFEGWVRRGLRDQVLDYVG